MHWKKSDHEFSPFTFEIWMDGKKVPDAVEANDTEGWVMIEEKLLSGSTTLYSRQYKKYGSRIQIVKILP